MNETFHARAGLIMLMENMKVMRSTSTFAEPGHESTFVHNFEVWMAVKRSKSCPMRGGLFSSLAPPAGELPGLVLPEGLLPVTMTSMAEF